MTSLQEKETEMWFLGLAAQPVRKTEDAQLLSGSRHSVLLQSSGALVSILLYLLVVGYSFK